MNDSTHPQADLNPPLAVDLAAVDLAAVDLAAVDLAAVDLLTVDQLAGSLRREMIPFWRACEAVLDDSSRSYSERLAASQLLGFLRDVNYDLDGLLTLAARWELYR